MRLYRSTGPTVCNGAPNAERGIRLSRRGGTCMHAWGWMGGSVVLNCTSESSDSPRSAFVFTFSLSMAGRYSVRAQVVPSAVMFLFKNTRSPLSSGPRAPRVKAPTANPRKKAMLGTIPPKTILWDAQRYYITVDELKDVEGTMVN